MSEKKQILWQKILPLPNHILLMPIILILIRLTDLSLVLISSQLMWLHILGKKLMRRRYRISLKPLKSTQWNFRFPASKNHSKYLIRNSLRLQRNISLQPKKPARFIGKLKVQRGREILSPRFPWMKCLFHRLP